MKIKVEKEYLQQIAEAIKGLPVKASNDFDTADEWVGIVIAIEKLVESSETCEEDAVEEEE